jgi:hypothetical protein
VLRGARAKKRATTTNCLTAASKIFDLFYSAYEKEHAEKT